MNHVVNLAVGDMVTQCYGIPGDYDDAVDVALKLIKSFGGEDVCDADWLIKQYLEDDGVYVMTGSQFTVCINTPETYIG